MELYIDIWVEDRESGNKTKANEAIYTFVAVDDTGRPVEVPKSYLKLNWKFNVMKLLRRKQQLSWYLAGKLNPQDATELKALFL
jgi:acyl-CoA hydrolase